MTNREKLAELVTEVFLLAPGEFRFDMRQDEIETWDSLGVVSLAVGVEEVFGYHMSPSEAGGLRGIADVIELLERNNVSFQEPA